MKQDSAKPWTSCPPLAEELGMCVGVFLCLCGANLDEVSGAAVDADVRQLQTDDLTGLGDDEGGTGQLWLRRREGEVAFSGQHVQASCKNTHITLIILTEEVFTKQANMEAFVGILQIPHELKVWSALWSNLTSLRGGFFFSTHTVELVLFWGSVCQENLEVLIHSEGSGLT